MSQRKGNPLTAFLIIMVIAAAMLVPLLPDPPIKTRPATEREKSEAGVQAILRKYGPEGQSEEEIRRGAKDVMDEWDRVTK